MAIIKISVDGRPDLPPFEMYPPKPAEIVKEKLAIVLGVETGTLRRGEHLFVGKAIVFAGEYIFMPKAAQATGRPYTWPW